MRFPPAGVIHEGFNDLLKINIDNMFSDPADLRTHSKVNVNILYNDMRSRIFEYRDSDVSTDKIYMWIKKILEKERQVLGMIVKYPSKTIVFDSESREVKVVDGINLVSVSKNRIFLEKKLFKISNNMVTPKYFELEFDDDVDLFEGLLNTEGSC